MATAAPLPDLFSVWTRADAHAWGLMGQPEGKSPARSSPARLPFHELPRSWTDVAHGEIRPLGEKYRQELSQQEASRRRAQPLMARALAIQEILFAHRTGQVPAQERLSEPALRALSAEKEQAEAAVRQSRRPGSLEAFRKAADALDGRWADYLRLVARMNFYNAVGLNLVEADRKRLHELIGPNPVSGPVTWTQGPAPLPR